MRKLIEALLDTGFVRVAAHALTKSGLVSANRPAAQSLFSLRETTLDLDQTNRWIIDTIHRGAPAMIARFGKKELAAVYHHWVRHSTTRRERFELYCENGSLPYPIRRSIRGLHLNAGVFPKDCGVVQQFIDRMVEDMPEVDLLASWLVDEFYFADRLSSTDVCDLQSITPFFVRVPWTSALKGKTVLVVHPFADTIESQYRQHRADIFPNTEILPEFELKTVKAVQSIAGTKVPFENWFDALHHMEDQIARADFDVAVIGCGAYGFPLAAHVKRLGKIAVHLGGESQCLFGIHGARWDVNPAFAPLINDAWVRPTAKERPEGYLSIEDGCYW